MKKKSKKCKLLVRKVIEGNKGYIVNRDVFVQSPPIAPTFELPLEEEISKVAIGDVIKLIFVNGHNRNGERMWVEVTRKLDITPVEWVGKLRNQPFTLEAKWDDVVRFSPKAIIDYEHKTEKI